MGRKSVNLIIPNSDDAFLSEFLTSLKKRSKSLKYNNQTIKCEKVYVEEDDARSEKIELEIHPYITNAKMHIDIWHDRWVSVSCWERSKDEKWDYAYDGKLIPIYGGQVI